MKRFATEPIFLPHRRCIEGCGKGFMWEVNRGLRWNTRDRVFFFLPWPAGLYSERWFDVLLYPSCRMYILLRSAGHFVSVMRCSLLRMKRDMGWLHRGVCNFRADEKCVRIWMRLPHVPVCVTSIRVLIVQEDGEFQIENKKLSIPQCSFTASKLIEWCELSKSRLSQTGFNLARDEIAWKVRSRICFSFVL